MDALQKLGEDGRTRLATLLKEEPTEFPIPGLDEFQMHNGVDLPILASRLCLVDLIEGRRGLYHEQMFVALRERLLNKIEEIRKKKDQQEIDVLIKSLDSYLVLIDQPMLRPVVLAAIETVPQAPTVILDRIYNEPPLYHVVGLEVKRQVWCRHEDLFFHESHTAIKEYAADWLQQLRQVDNVREDAYSQTSKGRREREAVKTIVNLPGKHKLLYDQLLSYIRAAYVHTKQSFFCSLRTDLCMVLHDMEQRDLICHDPCYSLTLTMDCIMREKQPDSKHIADLKKALSVYERFKDQVYGDVSLIFADPFCLKWLARYVIRIVWKCALKHVLPRQSTGLLFPLNLLRTGLCGWKYDASEWPDGSESSAMCERVVFDFLPLLCCQVASFNGAVEMDKVEPYRRSEVLQQLREIGASLLRAVVPELKKSKLNAFIYLFFVIELIRRRHLNEFLVHFQLLHQHCPTVLQSEQNLNLLVAALASASSSVWQDQTMFDLVFQNFLLLNPTFLMQLHATRLAMAVASHLNQSNLSTLVNKLRPDKDEHLQSLYAYFMARLKN